MYGGWLRNVGEIGPELSFLTAFCDIYIIYFFLPFSCQQAILWRVYLSYDTPKRLFFWLDVLRKVHLNLNMSRVESEFISERTQSSYISNELCEQQHYYTTPNLIFHIIIVYKVSIYIYVKNRVNLQYFQV